MPRTDRKVKNPPYCSQASRAAGESLYGSAPEADVWILIEYPAPWSARALADSALPATTLRWIAEQEESLTRQGFRPRTQFIKQRGRRDVPRLLAVADTRPGRHKLVGTTFLHYEELASMELAAAGFCADAELDPVLLVCTNGRRDRCCARFGGPVYDALRRISPHTVWQTTHLGGHRFAPAVLSLPDGLCFGRLSPDEALALQSGESTAIGHLRGRSAYPAPVQAAECFLLNADRSARDDQFELTATEDAGAGATCVTFRDTRTGVLNRLTIGVEHRLAQASCGANGEKRVPHYRLLDSEQANL
ncbi:MAG: sucrase ferredoxin [Gammaproteobacteria bacterium]